MPVYEVQAWPEGSWWIVEVPELGTAGQSASFAGVEKAAREVCAGWLDVPESEVEVRVRVRIPEAEQREWIEATDAEEKARQLQADAARRRRQVVASLRGKSYTLAAASNALGVSAQRLDQLARSGESS